MKKIKYIIITIVTFLLFINSAYAAGTASLTTSASTIENGKKVTASVTLNNVGAWNVRIASSGNTYGCTEQFVGDSGTGKNTNKTLSVTCTATSIGIINFTMSGDITSEDGVNSKISGSKSVEVVAPRAKSANNKLKSLSVLGFEISPSFDKNVNEYTVLVPSTTEIITINASKADSYSSVAGTGEKEVELGTNLFEIIVTSETGVSNLYTITVTVEDLNPIEVKIDNEIYTVVKELKNLTKPDLFDETTIKINDMDIPVFINKQLNYILVGLKNSEGNIALYIYKDGEYTKYKEFISEKINIVFLESPTVPNFFKKTVITINEEEVPAYKHNNIVLIYAANIVTGEKNFYKYNSKENVIQIFDVDEYIKLISQNKNSQIIIYALSGLLGLIILISILQSRNQKKYKKINKKEEQPKEIKKESKEDKNKKETKKTKKD